MYAVDKTPESELYTFTFAASRESIKIALTYASLNRFDVYTCDIQNACLQAPVSKKQPLYYL